jgi:cellulose synthase/poly-beta-1,6-N-acetylglucosamine synthase-like glycosyltransferase
VTSGSTIDDDRRGEHERPAVSVVMPIGGIDEFLPAQLDALAEQTFDRPWELVLSMNQPGTTGDPVVTGHRLHPLATRLVVDSSSERSAAHARNAGAEAATADLLAFCDADDIVEPTWLTALVDSLADHAVVGGYLDERRLSPPGQDRWRPPATPGELPSYLGHRYPVSANMAARRESFTKVDGFVEGLTRCEDIAFGWALADAGIDLGYAPEAVVHYRHRPGLWTMIRQHHSYGIGMTEVIERQGLPGGSAPSGLLAANKQRVTQRSVIHILRRGAIASGRLRGLIQERLTRRHRGEPPR